ncbi:MAG: diaminopimelate dehydrogenase, partial [Bacillota bacterium]|nr:diaminopimelate dehydrogenase [Bacillota bacterium]
MVLKVAVMGWGHVGRAAAKAVELAPDMKLQGVVRRASSLALREEGIPQVSHVEELGEVDVVLLAVPSREVPRRAMELLQKGYGTVDAFDIHGEIPTLRKELGEAAVQSGKAALVAVGWDPGLDSVIRALFVAAAPRGLTHTDFGPGLSLGHTVAVKSIPGVKDAFSLTFPLGSGRHRRVVYVVPEEGVEAGDLAAAIQKDPYFLHDETHVELVEDVESLKDAGHGVVIFRKGSAGASSNQLLRFEMRIDNPALTGQMMVAAARAATKMEPGA